MKLHPSSLAVAALLPLLLSACGSTSNIYNKPSEIQDKLKEQFNCSTLEPETHNKEDSRGRYDQDLTDPYVWMDCEIDDDGAPYGGASFTIRVAESKDSQGEKVYKNPTTESDSGSYYVLSDKNWALIPSNRGEEWKPWVERAQKALGGEIHTYENFRNN